MFGFSSYAWFHSSYSTQLFSTLHVTFIKIINVDKNNKRVYYFFVNFANVYYIYAWTHPSPSPKRHTDRFSRFGWAHWQRDRPTEHATPSVTIGRVYVRSTACTALSTQYSIIWQLIRQNGSVKAETTHVEVISRTNRKIAGIRILHALRYLWPPCVADANIIFLSCGYFFIFMAALCNIFALWFPYFFLSSSSFIFLA